MKYKEKIDELCKTIEQVSGVHLSFYGCNGEYSCSTFCPWSYLHGYHSRKDIYIYLDGVYSGLKYNKNF